MGIAKVSYENIVAGLLLKFGRVDKNDIDVVIEMLLDNGIIENCPSPYALDYRGISSYIVQLGENYYIVDSLEARKCLGAKQGEVFKEFIDTINIEEFVLRKINKLNAIPEYAIASVFNEQHEKVIDKLREQFLVVDVWNDDVPYEDYLEIQLTNMGRARLFQYEYKEEVEEFKKLLTSSSYDVNLLEDFLRAQDFSLGVYEILNIDNFLQYCNMFDRCPTVNVSDDKKLMK